MFKSPSLDTYVIFGEAKIEDLGAQAQASAAEQFRMQNAAAAAAEEAQTSKATEAEPEVEVDDDAEVDESGVEPKDIDLVMSQAGVSRAKAVRALKAADGDIVSAIMELTM